MQLPSRPPPRGHERLGTRLAALAITSLIAGGCLAPRRTGEPREAQAPFGDASVHYLDAGLGERALVLVHGWASDTSAWRHQFPDLADLGRLIAVDLPGHGKSDPPAEGYSMTVFADAIAAVLDHAEVTGAVLIGHSNGTPTVVNFYRLFPERTLGLVGIDGAMRNMVPVDTAQQMIAPFAGDDYRAAMEAMVDGMPGPHLTDEDRAAIKTMALGASQEAILGGFDAALDPNTWSTDPIEVPLLLLQARSPFWDSDYEAFVRSIAPDVDYRVWFDIGHYMQMERPAELRAALEEFLAQHALLTEE